MGLLSGQFLNMKITDLDFFLDGFGRLAQSNDQNGEIRGPQPNLFYVQQNFGAKFEVSLKINLVD